MLERQSPLKWAPDITKSRVTRTLSKGKASSRAALTSDDKENCWAQESEGLGLYFIPLNLLGHLGQFPLFM